MPAVLPRRWSAPKQAIAGPPGLMQRPATVVAGCMAMNTGARDVVSKVAPVMGARVISPAGAIPMAATYTRPALQQELHAWDTPRSTFR